MQRYDHGGASWEDGAIRLDFSVNVHPWGLPPQVRQALTEGLADWARYPDPACTRLRRALARHHGIEGEGILCGSGASDLILRLCAWRKPRLALVPAPTFSEYERSVRLFGGEVRCHPLRSENGFALTEAFLDDIVPGVDLVFLCTPNNPTGRLVDRDLLVRAARKCQAVGAILVVDECFLDFTRGESLAPLLSGCPRLLILRAFTKFYGMAGLRLGYLLGDPALLDRIRPFGPVWSVSVPAQQAGMAALEALPGWKGETLALIEGERAWLSGSLADLGLTVYPADGNFLLLSGPADLGAKLRDRGILVRDCANFPGLGPGYFRVGLKTRPEDRQLFAACKEVLYG